MKLNYVNYDYYDTGSCGEKDNAGKKTNQA